MREIKFRAYQPSAKEGDLKWWSWQELKESDLNTIFRHPEKYHLMQYTGLKDKNGVEIYEGDVVKGYYYINGVKKRIVGRVMFGYNGWIIASDIMWERATIVLTSACEVIGNIHDNPELLEVLGDG